MSFTIQQIINVPSTRAGQLTPTLMVMVVVMHEETRAMRSCLMTYCSLMFKKYSKSKYAFSYCIIWQVRLQEWHDDGIELPNIYP